MKAETNFRALTFFALASTLESTFSSESNAPVAVFSPCKYRDVSSTSIQFLTILFPISDVSGAIVAFIEIKVCPPRSLLERFGSQQ